MATGNPPFEGNSVKDTLARVQNGDFKLPKEISPSLQDLLKKLICWDTKSRIDINDVHTHSFFLENPQKTLHSDRLSSDNSNSSLSFADAGAFDDAECDFSKSTNCYNSGFQQIHQKPHHQKSSSVSLLKKPPLASKKLQASQFSFAASTASSENKENMGDSQTSLLSQNQKAFNKNQCISSEPGSESFGSPTYQPLQSVDLNTPNALNALRKRVSITSGKIFLCDLSDQYGIDSSSVSGADDQGSIVNNGVTPLNTNGLKPIKFKTKGGLLEISSNGWISLDIAKNKRKITISPDGLKV